jgi:hypothetical protein
MTTADIHQPAQPRAHTVPAGHRIVWSLASSGARLAHWPLWLLTTTVFGVFAGAFFTSSAAFAIPHVEAVCRQAPPDVRFTSSAADVLGFLTGCGAAGREAYRFQQVADLFYPTVFGMFMATSMALVIARLAPERHALLALAVLPLLGSVFDYLENVCAWLALAAFPGPAPTSSLLGLASAAKNLTFWTSGALLLGALALLVIAQVSRRARPRANGADPDASGASD